eukprot:3239421-Pleurochrysis_carterae.AAC.3
MVYVVTRALSCRSRSHLTSRAQRARKPARSESSRAPAHASCRHEKWRESGAILALVKALLAARSCKLRNKQEQNHGLRGKDGLL